MSDDLTSDDLTIAYQLGVEDMRQKLHKQADEIERLQQLNEYLRSEKERLSKDVYNLILKKEEVKTENEKLRLALKPFVKLQATFMASCNGAPDDYLIAENLPCGILRAAAAAIRETE